MSVTDEALDLLCNAATFVVVDVETCPDDDGNQRVVSIAAVTIRGGVQRGVWATLVNPEVPITNSRHHHLTDDDVADAPTFDQVVDELDKQLAGPDVVLVAHNAAGFDVGVLHVEHTRVDRTLRDVRVLDTMKLPEVVGHVVGKGRGRISLDRLADSFGLTNARPHDATADAAVTSEALLELLRVAAGNGQADLAGLLAEAGNLTTSTIGPREPRAALAPGPIVEIPAEHAATHADVLPAHPTRAELDAWVAGALECARWRCDLLEDKAQLASHHARTLHDRLTAELARLGPSSEPGQGATLLGAMNVLAARALAARSVMPWWRKNRPVIQALPRCGSWKCPACRNHQPCPIDVAHQAVVEARCFVAGVVPKKDRRGIAEVPTRCLVADWARLGFCELAGHAAALVATAWTDEGNHPRAGATIDLAVTVGAFDPTVIRYRAQQLVNQSRDADAVQLVTDALTRRTTAPGWADLAGWYATYQAAQRPLVRLPGARPGASTRVARPAGRTRPKRFAV